MTKIEILKIESLSREPLVVEGYLFKGKNKKAPKVAIVGSMEGEGVLPLYCSAKLVDFFKNKIDENDIKGDVLIIPSINHYAFNSAKRFWPLDNTNLNMMFPGYEQGETTQRIANRVFSVLKEYDYGIVLERRQDPVNCVPYIKLYQSGFEDMEGAKKFGFKFIHHKKMKSIDSVTLQYNWQLWETKAYSIMCPTTNHVDKKTSSQITQSILRFMNKSKIINFSIYNAYEPNIITTKEIKVIKSKTSGVFIPKEFPGDYVTKGQVLGEIIDSLEGNVIHEFFSPTAGMITCHYNHSLIYENAVAFRIAKIG